MTIIYVLALRSHSIKHSRTRILACTMLRFSLSEEVLFPAYVGRISRPMSSITASNELYLLCGWCGSWCNGCCCCWMWAWGTNTCACCACSCPGIVRWTEDEIDGWGRGGVALTSWVSSDRGVPGLLMLGVEGELWLLWVALSSSPIVAILVAVGFSSLKAGWSYLKQQTRIKFLYVNLFQ